MIMYCVECQGEYFGYFPKKSVALDYAEYRTQRTGDVHHVERYEFVAYANVEIERK